MSQVSVEFVGPVRRPWREQKRDLEIEDGTNVAALVERLGYSESDGRHLTVLVNTVKVKSSTVLSDGDEVVVTMIVGGG